MPASIGVNLRVTGHCRQGGRKYMEDFFSVAYQQTQDEKDLEYAFFGIFDGHGGMEAATFAKEHLMESIVRQKNFWSEKDDDVLKAIKDGYINTHYAMWREQEKWPKTASGLPSTAGTTASVAFIRRGKIYIGHVGDSGIILGFQEPGNPIWQAKPLTEDHKPENQSEMSRIEQSGGKVVTKSGVPRVVWNRPRIGHKGPVRRSTPIDEIPFLAVARSLGDLWSYNSALDEFVVSPDPDTICIPINAETFRCLIFGTDGLWNMISPASAVSIVQVAEQHNERTVLAAADSQDAAGRATKVWINPSKCLVERALERWSNTRMRADNTSVITLMLDPPGPPRAEVIKNQRLLENRRQQILQETPTNITEGHDPDFQPVIPEYPKNGLEILTMYEDPPIPENISGENQCSPTIKDQELAPNPPPDLLDKTPDKSEHRLTEENLDKIHQQILNDINSQTNFEVDENYEEPSNDDQTICETENTNQISTTETSTPLVSGAGVGAAGAGAASSSSINTRLKSNFQSENEPIIQINEVSSSSQDKSTFDDDDEQPCSRCTRSQDLKPKTSRKSQRNKSQIITSISSKQKLGNSRSSSTSPMPRRKTRSSLVKNPPIIVRKNYGTSKREHSDPEMKPPTVEPPQKLRRSQSLGPRDFTLRSQKNNERNLRDRNASFTSLRAPIQTMQGRNSLVTLSAGSSTSYKKITNNGKHFTPVKQAIQTRNRVKRLNK